MNESDIKDISNLPGWNELFTQVLNAITDAQENRKPRVVVVFELDHSARRTEMTIYDSGEPPAGIGYLN